MKKVNCAAIILAAMVGVGSTPVMASTTPAIVSGVNHQIASVAPLEKLAFASVTSNQQQQQQQQQQSKKISAGLKSGLFPAPNGGFAV